MLGTTFCKLYTPELVIIMNIIILIINPDINPIFNDFLNYVDDFDYC